MIRRALNHSLLIAAVAALCACAPTTANRGHIIDPDKLAEVQVNTSTREDVARILGTPTQVGTFDEKTWYYFGRSTKQYSFLDPEVVKQQAIEVTFNDEGTVTAINTLDPDQTAQNINPVGRRTPTYGHETTFLEQLLGNLGRPAGLAGKESKK